jgi:hypothetical protein
MTHAIIRGRNGRRHEVDFGDDAVAIEVGISDAVVEIAVEATQDAAPSDKRRFAIVSVPRDRLMAALGGALRRKTVRGEPPRPTLVSGDG